VCREAAWETVCPVEGKHYARCCSLQDSPLPSHLPDTQFQPYLEETGKLRIDGEKQGYVCSQV